METFSALLAICAGNSPVPGEFPTQRPVTQSFDVYFDLRPNKRLSKQSLGWWFETLSPPLWRHRNVYPTLNKSYLILQYIWNRKTWTTLFQIWRLHSTKPLHLPILEYCQWHIVNKSSDMSMKPEQFPLKKIENIVCKVVAILFRSWAKLCRRERSRVTLDRYGELTCMKFARLFY